MDSSNPSTLLVNKDNTKDVLVDKNNATKEYVTFTGKSHEHGESTKLLQDADDNQLVNHQLIATVVQFTALIGVSLGAAASQIMAGSIPEFELNTWRFGFLIIILIPVTVGRRCEIKVPWIKLPLLITNIIIYNASNILQYTAYIYLPVGLTDGLVNSIIIVGNALLSICIKSERKCVLYVAAVISIIGIVLMIQPPVMFSGANLPPPPTVNWTSPCLLHGDTLRNVTSGTEDTGIQETTLGYIFAALCAITYILRYYALSYMVATISPFNFAFWNALMGTCVSLILMGIFETPTLPLSGFCILMLAVHCVGNALITLCNPWSLQYISPTQIGMINSCKMAILMIYQYTFLRHIKPGLQNWVEILGAVICFTGMIGGPLLQIISSRKLQSKTNR